MLLTIKVIFFNGTGLVQWTFHHHLRYYNLKELRYPVMLWAGVDGMGWDGMGWDGMGWIGGNDRRDIQPQNVVLYANIHPCILNFQTMEFGRALHFLYFLKLWPWPWKVYQLRVLPLLIDSQKFGKNMIIIKPNVWYLGLTGGFDRYPSDIYQWLSAKLQ